MKKQPTKMPKTKLKVNGPKPLQEESSSKKKDKSAKSRSSTSKAKGANDEETGEMRTAEKPLTETEIQEKRKKNGEFSIYCDKYVLMPYQSYSCAINYKKDSYLVIKLL